MPEYGPRWGKLVHQFLGVVTLAYYLRLTHMIHHQKYLSKDYIDDSEYRVQNRLIFTGAFMPKKRRLGPQNGCGSLVPEKLPKIVNCVAIKET